GVEVHDIIRIDAGERKKNHKTVHGLYRELLGAGAQRSTTIVAIGGGTLTDIAGFVAATYMRGLAWIAVPTTVLAMVDAAIGGKTGIDLPEGKNLVGALWEPQAVIADLIALESLPLAQRRAGLAEVIKAAIIADPAMLETVYRLKLRAAGPQEWGALIDAAAGVKARIVGIDPREQGVRAKLNLGHTTAHAVEWASRYAVAHGPALAMGLRVEGMLARDITGWQLTDHTRVLRTLRKVGLPLKLPALELPDLLLAMRHDKKRTDAELNFVLPVRLGEVRSGVRVEERVVAAALQAALAAPVEGGW
ncbi:MAG: 3-dehydroquinate synthase, partial [Candidatus Eremiobacteraeota bacterium]|nr:3-dehydroquinate synthase [Candidatus Eremiobacteraeota bacterium]